MTITYTWAVVQMYCYPEADGNTATSLVITFTLKRDACDN